MLLVPNMSKGSGKKIRCDYCRREFTLQKTLMEHLNKNRCPALRNRTIKNENFTSRKRSNKITYNIVAKYNTIAKDNAEAKNNNSNFQSENDNILSDETIKEKKTNKRKNLPTSIRNKIAGDQHYKCNNTPGSKLSGLVGYECPLWKLDNDSRGSFDAAGFDIDHILEVSKGGSDKRDNLQALCPSCHAYKTRNFRSE